MITTGRHVPAPEALKLGILDEVLPEGADLRSSAIAYARAHRRCARRCRGCATAP